MPDKPTITSGGSVLDTYTKCECKHQSHGSLGCQAKIPPADTKCDYCQQNHG